MEKVCKELEEIKQTVEGAYQELLCIGDAKSKLIKKDKDELLHIFDNFESVFKLIKKTITQQILKMHKIANKMMNISYDQKISKDSNQVQYSEIINKLNCRISKLNENYNNIKEINTTLRNRNEMLVAEISKINKENDSLKELLINEESINKPHVNHRESTVSLVSSDCNHPTISEMNQINFKNNMR